ncbi:MAG: alginate export family protein [Candidatus Marinimicrobia bacterium]|nr:alginate export family protein [Candidatus Neomarinimicrobiota bacterium]
MERNHLIKIGISLLLSLMLTIPGLLIAADSDEEKKEESSEQVKTDWHNISPNLKIGGSLRVRAEDKNSFNFVDSNQDYMLTQLRLNISWKASENVKIFLEGQDARVMGEEITAIPSINRDATPNIFADQFDLHQGFVDVNFSANRTPVKIRAGRQKFNLGTQRLVASLEWVNTARVWDGVRVTVGNAKSRNLDIIASRLVPVSPNRINDYSRTKSRYFNSQFHILYYTDKITIPNTQWESYLMLRRESQIDDNVYTFGTRFTTVKDSWLFEGEAAAQSGTYSGFTHKAFMAHIGTEYKTGVFNNAKVGTAYNFGSGDGVPNDQTHSTFDNLYPLNHAYYGYMDLFSLQNIHNFEVTFKNNPLPKLGLRVAYQGFWLHRASNDAWYNAGSAAMRNANGADVSSYVGSEIDITVKYPFYNKRIVGVVGVSQFFKGAYVDDVVSASENDASFYFVQTKIKF